MTMDTNKNYGGKRNGAGRPRKGKELRENISFSVDVEVKRMAKELREDGANLNEMVELFVAAAYAEHFGAEMTYQEQADGSVQACVERK